jgi:hypothetical protein
VEDDPPRVFGIQAVRVVSLLSEEPKVTLYVRHSTHRCHQTGALGDGGVASGPSEDCLAEWPIAGGDLKPSEYENYDGTTERKAKMGPAQVVVEAPYQLLGSRKHAHVWYHSVEMSQIKGNVGFLGVRLGTKSPGNRPYVLRTHMEPLIPLNDHQVKTQNR